MIYHVYSLLFFCLVLSSYGEELSALKMDTVILTKDYRYIYDIPYFLLSRLSYLMLVASCFSKHIYIIYVILPSQDPFLPTCFQFLPPILPTDIHTTLLRRFPPKTRSTMVNTWQELDICRSTQRKLARFGGCIELIYQMELLIWRLEVHRMRNSCLRHVVCLSTMTSNSNVIKVDFEFTSTVVAKLVIKNSLISFPTH